MKTIRINGYPATFEFKIRTKLPKFDNDSDSELNKADWDNMTDEQYRNRKNYQAEEVRNRLLLKYLTKLKIYSFGHRYEDYVVEVVTETPDGEIWQLGS
jgi:hypothetical protein